MKSKWPRFILFVLLSGLLTSIATAQSPARLFISQKTDDFLRVSVKHVEGLDEVILRRVERSKPPRYLKDAQEDIFAERPTLYRGTLRREGRSGTLSASADEIASKLRVTFHGRRRGRLISIRASGENKDEVADETFVPSFARFRCGLSEGAALISEETVQSPTESASAAKLTPLRTLTVSSDADEEYYSMFQTRTHAQIEALFNTANAIYMNQLGIELAVTEIAAFTSTNQPYRSDVGADLLCQFQDFNNQNKRLTTADVYHLFTGKNLIPEGMVGLSYVGSVCQDRGLFSYGLSSFYPSSVEAIILAHELGHNLGATHTDSGIMLPNLSSNPRTFSGFSIDQITGYVQQYGSCMSTASPSVSLARVSLSKTGRFRAVLTPGGNLNGTCNMDLYASTRTGALRAGTIFKNARRLARYSVQEPGIAQTVRGVVEPDRTVPRKVYLKGAISCGNGTGFSTLRSVQVRARNLSRFYSALAKSIAGQ